MFLQSSMNIEDGLGTASLFTIYFTSSLSTIFLIPFLIDFLGAKIAIVLGEIGIIAFTAANLYPSKQKTTIVHSYVPQFAPFQLDLC